MHLHDLDIDLNLCFILFIKTVDLEQNIVTDDYLSKNILSYISNCWGKNVILMCIKEVVLLKFFILSRSRSDRMVVLDLFGIIHNKSDTNYLLQIQLMKDLRQ